MIGGMVRENSMREQGPTDWEVYTLSKYMCDLYNMRRTKATNENGYVMAIKGPLSLFSCLYLLLLLLLCSFICTTTLFCWKVLTIFHY